MKEDNSESHFTEQALLCVGVTLVSLWEGKRDLKDLQSTHALTSQSATALLQEAIVEQSIMVVNNW